MDLDARIWKLGETQRGHVTGEQARAEGMTRKQLYHRRRQGGWVEVLPDVFRLPGAPASEAGTLTAIQLWMGPGGHYCGPTAIYLYGLDGAERPDRFNVALHTGGGHPLVKVHRLAPHDRPPTRGLDGLRVVRLERGLAEMAAARPPPLVGRALDDALRKKLTTLPRMKSFLETEWGRGRRGARVLQRLLAARNSDDVKVRSDFETRMMKILRRIGAPAFEPDHEVRTKGRRFKLDFCFPSLTLGIECHSFRWHAVGHAADAKRHRLLMAAGYEILYFTWDEVVFAPDAVEAEIRAAIARRTAQLATSSSQSASQATRME